MADEGIQQIKRCTKCSEKKPLDQFSLLRTVKSGRRSRCKSCEAAAGRVYYAKNAEKCRTAYRDKYAKNPEHFRERSRVWHRENVGRAAQRNKNWKAQNAEAVRNYNKKHYAANKELSRERFLRWLENNKPQRQDYMRLWRDENSDKQRLYNRRRLESVKTRIENAIRCRIWWSITKGSKGARRTFALLGYTVEHLRAHLERQFLRGMTWENYGEWHIDHIVPLASFSYSSPDDEDFKAAWALTNLRPMWKVDNMSKGAKRLTLL